MIDEASLNANYLACNMLAPQNTITFSMMMIRIMTLGIHDTHHNYTTIMLNDIMLSVVILGVVVPSSDLFRDNSSLLLMTFFKKCTDKSIYR